MHFFRKIDKIYQLDFPRVVILKRFTTGANRSAEHPLKNRLKVSLEPSMHPRWSICENS